MFYTILFRKSYWFCNVLRISFNHASSIELLWYRLILKSSFMLVGVISYIILAWPKLDLKSNISNLHWYDHINLTDVNTSKKCKYLVNQWKYEIRSQIMWFSRQNISPVRAYKHELFYWWSLYCPDLSFLYGTKKFMYSMQERILHTYYC